MIALLAKHRIYTHLIEKIGTYLIKYEQKIAVIWREDWSVVPRGVHTYYNDVTRKSIAVLISHRLFCSREFMCRGTALENGAQEDARELE